MKSAAVLLLLALPVLIAAGPVGAQEAPNQYVFPANLGLTLTLKGVASETGTLTLEAQFEALVGKPEQVNGFFETSNDFTVTPGHVAFDVLEKGIPQVQLVTVRPASGTPDASGSWVRLRTVYLPDYVALTEMFSDAKKFPNPPERQRMLKIIRGNDSAEAPQTDAVRFDLERFRGLGRHP